MTVIGIVLLAVGFVVALCLALADPVLLSRINGEPAEGASGRHVQAPPIAAVAGTTAGTAAEGAEVVPFRPRRPDDREPQAA
ncbi:hypothetical protein [Planomonospora parontospora]|uniref:hypothetical protein n=1 Tax=Planomonospora parontospora TaxID=58119 RepID=UPI001670E53B|nr:hypothetical protein [Planomonospora parontospora]GGL11451.1 hypothetical protein GCM10014719_11660 [Planomonospora parontospora subsp. antibiotica]GII14880.1 hypothetical protein Ppa05_16060 [Planomonospora parontospora subsp. antibiotica]